MHFLLWWIYGDCDHPRASQVALVVKKTHLSIYETDEGLIPGLKDPLE